MHPELNSSETTSIAGEPAAGAPTRPSAESVHPLSPRQWRQLGVITALALGVFAFLRWLPTGTNLSHMDFRVDAPNAIEFCDPANPQFIPVVAVASPVSLTLRSEPARIGEDVRVTAVLQTAGGKAIASEDLLVVHTRRLHLLIVDPTLHDYQHVHPEPGSAAGEWTFAFTPRRSGTYRVFADFTPAATSRGLYAHADLPVAGTTRNSQDVPVVTGTAEPTLVTPVQRNDHEFILTPASQPLRAGQPADLKFTVRRPDGGEVSLLPVMDAFAHLVAFDEMRSGFAHLHPAQLDPTQRPDAVAPTLDFKITIPRAGRYVIWAQVNLGGRETFVPFWFEVAP